MQPLQQTQLQPPFGQSVDSLCHPWVTTTNLSYRFPILKLPPPPCAALLVVIAVLPAGKNRFYQYQCQESDDNENMGVRGLKWKHGVHVQSNSCLFLLSPLTCLLWTQTWQQKNKKLWIEQSFVNWHVQVRYGVNNDKHIDIEIFAFNRVRFFENINVGWTIVKRVQ